MGQEPDRMKSPPGDGDRVTGPAAVSALRADIERERDALSDEVAELDRRRHAALGWTKRLGGRKTLAIAAGVGVVALVAGAFLLRRTPIGRAALLVGKRSRPWLTQAAQIGLAAIAARAGTRDRAAALAETAPPSRPAR